MDIASGLHVPLAATPALADAAQRTGRALHDVRLSKQQFPIGKIRASVPLSDCAE